MQIPVEIQESMKEVSKRLSSQLGQLLMELALIVTKMTNSYSVLNSHLCEAKLAVKELTFRKKYNLSTKTHRLTPHSWKFRL